MAFTIDGVRYSMEQDLGRLGLVVSQYRNGSRKDIDMRKTKTRNPKYAGEYVDFSMILGRKIANARMLRGLSQGHLAKSIGVTSSYVTKIEGGKNNMGTSLEVYYLVARELGLTLRDLFSFTKYDSRQAKEYMNKKAWLTRYQQAVSKQSQVKGGSRARKVEKDLLAMEARTMPEEG